MLERYVPDIVMEHVIQAAHAYNSNKYAGKQSHATSSLASEDESDRDNEDEDCDAYGNPKSFGPWLYPKGLDFRYFELKAFLVSLHQQETQIPITDHSSITSPKAGSSWLDCNIYILKFSVDHSWGGAYMHYKR